MDFIVALSPILLILGILFFLRKTTLQAGVYTYIYTLFLVFLFPNFKLKGGEALLATYHGFLIAFIAAYVLFFGILLFNLMNSVGAIEKIAHSIAKATDDGIVQVLILGVGLSPLIESTSGFGVAVMMVTPIFIALGYPVFKGILLGLISLMAIPWGAMSIGTIIGAEMGGVDLLNLGLGTAFLSVLPIAFFILSSIYIAGGWEGLKRRFPLGILFSLSFTTSLIIFNYLGAVELAGVLSGLVVLGLGFLLIKSNSVVSSAKGSHPADEELTIDEAPTTGTSSTKVTAPSLFRIFSPYLLLTAMILVTRLLPPVKNYLENNFILEVPRFSYSLALLYSPGFWLFLTCLWTIFLFKIKKDDLKEALRKSIKQWIPFTVVTTAFVSISEVMSTAGMIEVVAGTMASSLGSAFLMISPLIGALGGFLTGSNASSNAMLIKLQTQTAFQVGASPELASIVQNTSSSHTTMASPARVALGASLYGVGDQENALLRRILLFAGGGVGLVILSLLIWY
ncbi:MAG: L-lactate permease [Desulfitobacterium sp.]|nr:L-lactate permease [Desulfitobacterium sp.]